VQPEHTTRALIKVRVRHFRPGVAAGPNQRLKVSIAINFHRSITTTGLKVVDVRDNHRLRF
jgi:hypothetical protein